MLLIAQMAFCRRLIAMTAVRVQPAMATEYRQHRLALAMYRAQEWVSLLRAKIQPDRALDIA
jgi:hypothetical protein